MRAFKKIPAVVALSNADLLCIAERTGCSPPAVWRWPNQEDRRQEGHRIIALLHPAGEAREIRLATRLGVTPGYRGAY
jgi:hypothetical protein